LSSFFWLEKIHGVTERGINSFLGRKLGFKCFHTFNLHGLVGEKGAQRFTQVSYKGFGEGDSCPSLQQDVPVQREMISSKHHQETKTTPWKA
jgi:hypothetical protein